MQLRKKRLVRLGGAVAAATALTLAVSGTPASANVSQGNIAGAGTITDDWGDEGPLSTSHYSKSRAVGLWQWVLWAERVEKRDGTIFGQSDIDCDFGPNTDYATKQLQKRWGLTQDGIVGTKTFGRADNNLFRNTDTASVLYYEGDSGTKRFVRLGSGFYSYEPPGSAYIVASYHKTGC